jgi:hypothetical protein
MLGKRTSPADGRSRRFFKAFSPPVCFSLSFAFHLLTQPFPTVFQFAYTTLFGWYAAFLFIRTGSLRLFFLAATPPILDSLSFPLTRPTHFHLRLFIVDGESADWRRKKTYFPFPNLDSTGSILPPFFAHALCNSLGLPPLGWALQVWPHKKICAFVFLLSFLSFLCAISVGF